MVEGGRTVGDPPPNTIEINHVPNLVEIQTKADRDSSGGGRRKHGHRLQWLKAGHRLQWLKAEGGKKLGFLWRKGTLLPELMVDQVERQFKSDQVERQYKSDQVVVADEGNEEV